MEFLSNLNVKLTLHERKTPYWRLPSDGSVNATALVLLLEILLERAIQSRRYS